jgi:predicted lipoprotein with Yx(FWY)xxD motif
MDEEVVDMGAVQGDARWAAGLRGRLAFGLAVGAVAVVAAACGSSSGSTTTTTAAAASGGSMVTVKTAKIGSTTVLTDSAGFTLYTYSLDKPGKIACTGTCETYWHPLLVPSGDSLASMSGLGTETRPGGDVQVTYKGSPVYTYVGDSKPGQDNGISVADWHVASTTASSSGTTTTSAPSGGYGY